MNRIRPLHRHYAFENPGTIYDEDAVTALELCARTAHKTNECVDAFNRHLDECDQQHKDHLDECDELYKRFTSDVNKQLKDQDQDIKDAVDYMKDNIRETTNQTIKDLDKAGALDGVLQSNYFVTPQMYGAVGDGVTDDTEAFQKAMDENKRIFVPAGTYYISSVLRPGNCEVIGAVGSVLRVRNPITYDGVYYPRMSGLTLQHAGAMQLLKIRESYYGAFNNIKFQGPGSSIPGVGVLIDGVLATEDDNGTYYHRFTECTFSEFASAMQFQSIANAHSVEKCVFYACKVCIDINSSENIVIRDNTFQSFTTSAIKFQNTLDGHAISSLVMGNYFEANAESESYIGDIDFTNDSKCTGNFIMANHYTYTDANTHVVNMSGCNMVMDYYVKQESNAPNTLMGFTALEVLPSTYLNYGGSRFKGTVAPMQDPEADTHHLYFYGDENGDSGWKRVLTTGLSENDTVNLPPISSPSINQYYGGYFKMGYDADTEEDHAITYDSNQGLIKMFNGQWEYYQKVDAGATTARPTWKPRGYMYYDTTLGKPIWSTGSNTWVDATGAEV